jgi:hypothetical protein
MREGDEIFSLFFAFLLLIIVLLVLIDLASHTG